MAEHATVLDGIQIGVESTYGVAVAANKKLQALALALKPEHEDDEFMPKGSKLKTISVPNKEWSSSGVDGQPTYNEIIYPLAGLLNSAVVTTTGVSTWTFTCAQSAPDAIQSFTIEEGSSVYARKVAGAVFSGLTFDWDRNGGLSIGGDVFAKATVEGITMTASPTILALIPMLTGDVNVYMDPTFAAIGTTQLTRAFKAAFSLTGKFKPVYVLNRGAGLGHTAFVEVAPELKLELEMEYDTQGASLFTQYRNGAMLYFRVECISPTNIAGGTPTTAHSLVLDFCGRGKPMQNGDVDGVSSIQWEVVGLFDAGAAKAFSIIVKNGLAAL